MADLTGTNEQFVVGLLYHLSHLHGSNLAPRLNKKILEHGQFKNMSQCVGIAAQERHMSITIHGLKRHRPNVLEREAKGNNANGYFSRVL